MIDPTPIFLKPEDRADDDDGSGSAAPWLNQPADTDAISALTEAQLLEIAGKFGAIRSALLTYFQPHRGVMERKHLVRMALGAAEQGTRIAQAVLGSTVRG
jgi:hypothetical protein